jgi:putative ABC transport system permease protein
MQKVGMSQDEVKGTIKSQILLVFFLPLLVAAVHTAFAFPILTRLLRALFSADKILFLICTLGALAVFAVLYVVIYGVTARTYYKLVRWECA